MSPSFIRSQYSVDQTANSYANISLGAFDNALSFGPSGLSSFQQMFGLSPLSVRAIPALDEFCPSCTSAVESGKQESTLDVQWSTAMAQGDVTAWWWQTASWMYTHANTVYSREDAPLVHSWSYSWSATHQCELTTACNGIDSQTYIARTNTEFIKIGLTGRTIVVAAGDAGVWGKLAQQCSTSSGSTNFNPNFPASSPHVTAVGATQLTATSGNTEVSCSKDSGAAITSGGGFSEFDARPWYQTDAVSGYLNNAANDLPPSNKYLASNRGYPDVAAFGHNFPICYIPYDGSSSDVPGCKEREDGTSASTPLFAAMIAILNGRLIAQGKPPLGPINPLLYKLHKTNPAVFTDITTGNNFCTEQACCDHGFYTAKGWDPVTGLGTLNFAAMADAIGASANSDFVDNDGSAPLPSDQQPSGTHGGTVLLIAGVTVGGLMAVALFVGFLVQKRKKNASVLADKRVSLLADFPLTESSRDQL